jgi:hypothetical protein
MDRQLDGSIYFEHILEISQPETAKEVALAFQSHREHREEKKTKHRNTESTEGTEKRGGKKLLCADLV